VQVGDLLVRAGDRELDGLDTLHAAIDTGDALTLGVVRGTEEREVHVRLAAAEARA
jgi:S1-C subfamily serine protease